MSARILFVHPMGTDMYNEWTIEVLTPAAGPDTEIAVRHLPGLPATPFVTEAELWRDDFFGAVVDAERDGFDVVVSACTSEAAIRSNCWAGSSSRCPDLVRRAPCLPRSKRRVPSSFSRPAVCSLIVEWVTWGACAPAVKLPRTAISTNAR